MINFLSHADTVVVAAPYDVLSGAGCQVGGLFGVAALTALSGVDVPIKRTGEFELAKAASQAWAVGDPIYWDNSAKVCNNINTNDLFIGFCSLAVAGGAGDTLGQVVLVPSLSAVLQGIGGVGAGYKIARGQHTTIDADDTVVTGLATVVSAVASLESDPVIGAATANAVIGNQSGAPAAGSIQIKTFCPTSNSNPTPIPATTFSKLVNWIAVGT